MKKFSLSALLLLSLQNCGDILSGLSSEETETAYLNSALAMFSQALNVVENVEPFSAQNFLVRSRFANSQNPRPTASGDCTVADSGITASSCSGVGVQTFTYNDCQGQFTGATYSGILSLDFSISTCSFSTLAQDQEVLVSTSTHQTTGSDGSIILWSSALHQNFLGTNVSGGYTLVKENSSTYYLQPTGIRRLKSTASQAVIFDHSIRPNNNSSLTLGTGFTTGNRSITGSIAVDSNSKAFTATLNFIGVEYDQVGCAYPTVGTVDVTFGGSKSGTQSFGFEAGSCGTIKDTLSNTVYTLDPAY